MSDEYRDGCPSKRFSPAWVLVQLVLFASWLLPPRGRHRR